MEVVSREQLEAIVRMQPSSPPREETRFRPGSNGHKEFDLEEWMLDHHVPVKRKGPWQRGGWRWVLEECPWNGHTDNSAFIVQWPTGIIGAGCHHNSCQGYGWRDLREHYEPGAYDRHADAHENGSYSSSKANSANNANSANGDKDSNDGPEPWSPPAAFHSFELPEFPRDVFPEWVGKYIQALAEATQTPQDLPGMLALSVGASADAKAAEVEIWEGWREQLNIFTVTGLRPGSRKTIVFQRMCAPLEAHEAQLIEETASEISEQRTKYKIYEERLKKAQTKASKAEGDELDVLTAEAMQAASDLDSIKVPAQPRLLVDDASPERLTTLLADQGGRITLMSPEGGVFDMMAGRYSQGVPNLDVYLKGHAGDALRVDRVGRPSDYIQNPALTLGLAVQPDVLRGLANKPGFRGRGLLGRFLYAMPRDTLGKRTIRPKVVPWQVEATYNARMTNLLELSPDLPEEERQAETLRLEPEAQEEMEQLLEWIEPKLAEDGEFGDMTDWAGKLAGAVARIAGILHMLEYAKEKEPWQFKVSGDTFRRAVKIGHYLIPHARYVLAFMGSDATVEEAKYILRWVERKACQTFTKREAFEGTKGRFGKVSELEPGLELLVSHGYLREMAVREERRGPGRKPSPTYEVNPLWVGEDAETKSEHHSHNSHYSQNGNGSASEDYSETSAKEREEGEI